LLPGLAFALSWSMLKYVKIISKSIAYPLLLLMMVAVALLLALRTSYVQTRLAQYFTQEFSQKLGYPIYVDRVEVLFFDRILLRKVQVKDPNGQRMIDMERLEVDFNLEHLQDSTRTLLDHAQLYKPFVRLIIDQKGDMNLDRFIYRINQLTASPEPRPKNQKSKPFVLSEAEIVDGYVSLNDLRKPKDPEVFDLNHFDFYELNAKIRNFTTVADTVSLEADELRFLDKKDKLRVHNLKTRFLISDRQMRFDQLFFKFNDSWIRNRAVFSFRSQDDFGDWNRLVNMSLTLDSSRVTAADLGIFVSSMRAYRDTYTLNGTLSGTVDNLTFNRAQVYFGKQSQLRGDFWFKGLPYVDKTQMNLAAQNTIFEPEDLRQYIGSGPTDKITKFGRTTFDGSFVGDIRQFQTKGVLLSDLGKVVADLTMDLKSQSANSSYIGDLTLEQFRLGKFLESEKTLQGITMSGKIKGQGFSLADASLILDGKIEKIGVNNYEYDDVQVDGTLKQGQFAGRVSIKDTNLIFDLKGEVDLRNGRDFFDLHGKLSRFNLKPLHFSEKDIRLQTNMDVQFEGTDLDKMLGQAVFMNSYLSIERRNLIVDTLRVDLALKDKGLRRFDIRSDLLDATLAGTFLPSKAISDLNRLIKEYRMYFESSAKQRRDYHTERGNELLVERFGMLNYSPSDYGLRYRFLFKNFDPVIHLLAPDVHLARQSRLEGDFQMGTVSLFTAEGRTDTLELGKYKLYKAGFDLQTSKMANLPEVLASVQIKSKSQELNVLAPTDSLWVDAFWEKDHIAFRSKIKQRDNTNRARLNGELNFLEEGISFKLRQSQLKILNQDWWIDPDNFIQIKGNDILARNFRLSSQEQLVAMDGQLSDDSTKIFLFEAKDFRLETLAPLVQLDVKGVVNGNLSLQNIYHNPNFMSKLRVDSLQLEKFLVGNVQGEGRWDETRQRLVLDYGVERLGIPILNIKGTYDPSNSREAIDLAARLNRTDFQILESFTKGLFSQIRGEATGQIGITGSLANPRFKGQVEVRKGLLYFDYLKTALQFEDKVDFDEEGITTKKLRITDEEGNRASLTGGVYFGGAGEYTLQLDAKMKNFKIMNTTLQDNGLFYGTAYATGDLSIFGPFNALNINARSLRSERGTAIAIPLGQSSAIGESEDVEFVDLAKISKDSTLRLAASKSSSGIKMDFNFDITPDASCEIQFNKQTGDVMRANGAGRIHLLIDTKGDFNMTGDYTIDRGNYTFTFQNIINKQFDIQRGSRISWSGDPYEALIDIRAIYSRNISYLGGVIDTTRRGGTFQNRPEFTRRYPVDVYILLKDRLLTPQINFDMKFRDYPQNVEFNQAVTAFENKIRTDEQELNRQVTALVLANQMIAQNSSSFGQLNLVSNFTELLSNQLSNWASQVDKNLNIDLSLGGGLNQDLINNLQLRFSYNFNNRLRITRSGGLTNANSQANAQTLIGDWSLEWVVTPDGSVRLKTYSRNVQSSILTGSFTNFQTFLNTGFSILYTKSFNQLFAQKRKYFPSSITAIDDQPKADGPGIE
jgi:TamB, inner membrane protein subunit of TAM complex